MEYITGKMNNKISKFERRIIAAMENLEQKGLNYDNYKVNFITVLLSLFE